MLNCEKESFILDTSAFLSLETIDLLEEVLQQFIVVTTPSVINELNDFARHNDELGRIAKKVLAHQQQLVIKAVEIKEQIIFLEQTDNELYNLALTEKLPVITDDYTFNHHARKKITVYFSTFYLMFFALTKVIPKQLALQKLESLRELRNWNNNIMYLKTRKRLEQIRE